MKRILTVFFALTFGILCADEVKPESLILKGNARVADGILILDGKNSFAQLPGTEEFNIGKEGLSFACAVRLRQNLKDRKTTDSFDMFFSKGGVPFIFGRYGGDLYTNIRDAAKKNEFAAQCLVGRIPEAGVWTHVAVTFEHYDDHAQGDVGYYTTIYVNGDPVARTKHPGLQPVTNRELLEVGKGWGGVWFLDGDMTEIHADRRVMNESEIAELVDSSRFVKGKPTKKVNPALKKYTAASPAGRWALEVLSRIPTERGTAVARDLESAFKAKEDTVFVNAFGASCQGIVLLVRKDLLLLVDSKADADTPLLGVYDRLAQRAVLEDKLFNWTAKGIQGKKKLTIDCSEAKCTAVDFTRGGFIVKWETGSPVKLKAESVFTVSDSRITADLKIDNRSPDFILMSVVFPETRTAKAGNDDGMFYPYQCGAVVNNPTKNTFKYGQNGRYPGSTMTMQFSAYFGNGRGVFLGWEDPLGTAKNFQSVGKRGGVEFVWEQDVAIPLDKVSGGNSYASPGNAAFEVYSGEWFEACMIHKKWALSKAVWRINELPRRDTPEWFRNMTVTLEVTATTKELARLRYNQLMFLRRYIGLPLYGSWYLWYDLGKGSWPAFKPLPFTLEICKDMLNGGCYVEPYIDSRLWDILDGPDRKSDWRWSTHGKKFAVKLADGTIPMEHYGSITYAVMCPCAKGWQEELFELTKSVAAFAPAVYHDQVMTAQGFRCFDRTHGHALNAPKAWITEGYRPLYERIRKATPNCVHTSEEVSEPYVNLFDGGHIWRWTFDGQVPAFQAVYGGRMQYLALVYDSHGKGEYKSNFVKLANSMVNGLMLGKMGLNELYNADAKRVFLKKMAHLRLALINYFNVGEMLPPVKFATPVPVMTTEWATSSKVNEPVTMPKIVSNSYQYGENRVFLFVNTTEETLTVKPRIEAIYLCLEGMSAPVRFEGKTRLGAYQTAVAVKGSAAEAERIQKTLLKIASFTPGDSFDSLVEFKDHREFTLAKGDFAGTDKISGFYNCTKAVSGKYFGNTVDGSLISYGTVDFGTSKVTEITISAAVPEQYAGGTIDLLTGPNQNVREVAGTFTVPATDGWTDFQDFTFKLNRPMTGKCNIIFRFNRNACCNFAGWKY